MLLKANKEGVLPAVQYLANDAKLDLAKMKKVNVLYWTGKQKCLNGIPVE